MNFNHIETHLLENLDSGVLVINDKFQVCYANQWLKLRTPVLHNFFHADNSPLNNESDSFLNLFPDLYGSRLFSAIELAINSKLPSVLSHLFSPSPLPIFDLQKYLKNDVQLSDKRISQSIKITPVPINRVSDTNEKIEVLCLINISDISSYVLREDTLQEQIDVRKATEYALEQEKQLFFAGPCVTFKLKCDGVFTIVSVSPNVKAQFGFLPEDLLQGRSFLEIIHIDDKQSYLESMEFNIQQENYHFELTYRVLNNKGEIRWVNDFLHIIYDQEDEIEFFHGYIVDITEQKESELEMKQQAYYDALTNLPNRRMLTEKLERELDRSSRKGFYSALMYLDLDKFKYINDSLGHDVGDSLLIEVAQRIQQSVRKLDMGVRMGGDEFVVLLSDLGTEKDLAVERASNIAEKIRYNLSNTYFINDNELHTSPSIGVSLFSGMDNEERVLEDIIQHADTAMYKAKEEGRNTVRFYSEIMQKLASKRIEIEKNLRMAVKKGEMRLLFQPQISHARDLIACEALVRWEKDGEVISPVDFIPIAEETGAIVEIGEWVLHESCKAFKAWQADESKHSGFKMQHIAVNVSPRQFRDDNFLELIAHVLKEFDMQPNELEIEITEGIVIDNVEQTIKKMNQLRDMGIRLAMDDFGTGYSSLSYLKRLPLNILKIDQAFIRDANFNPDDKAIVSTIIAMAKKLSMVTVAEGIENSEILDFLETEGCSVYQGYYFSKPISFRVFSDFLRNWNDPLNEKELIEQ